MIKLYQGKNICICTIYTIITVVIKDTDVNEHESLSNFTL